MKILSETPVDYVNMEVDLTEKERSTFLEYARNSMDVEEIDELLIEWAIVDILKKSVEEHKVSIPSNTMSSEEANEYLAQFLGTTDPERLDKWWKTPLPYLNGEPPLVVWSTNPKWIEGLLKPY